MVAVRSTANRMPVLSDCFNAMFGSLSLYSQIENQNDWLLEAKEAGSRRLE
ncbi:hypothetical protein VIN01S_11360 [Vibrio inusitatus NBRC 102082]|uniref:Uncharacterized protein n=1 Tax=Vibrio inusitatus NBRC 102082 TaxID=1219070 RepID=A0A4Y3HU98_9VIBR|nr:hypothetical protein VIN01S_11360 [Vibrio inusitatus NBRC 102082]